jgi:two-component system NtrC family sensor kinase
VYLEVSARLLDDGSTTPGLHCIARNLTDRRRLELQLMQAEKLSALGQLVAGVAHELNNPLTSVSGYAQLLLREPLLPDQVHEDIQHIYSQSERAARIVQNLLLFAREHKPERVLVNLNDLVKSTLSLRAYQLRVDNVTVTMQIDPQLTTTVADPHQIQQVLLNLINNAHQAMVARGGPGTLILRTRQVHANRDHDNDEPGESLQIEISDTGVGIPERDLLRIFDPFFTTKPVGQGTGLGLSICFGIVQEHGGRIWAESTLNVGTTVFVELPLRSETSTDASDGVNPASAIIDNGKAARVLVVDDEEPVGRLLARLLRGMGHRPEVVSSGEAALAAMDREAFDLIITDVKMPGMSGFDLYDEVQRRNAEMVNRIVFVTGDILAARTQARLAQMGNPYVAKPFSIERLQGVVRTLLRSDAEVPS